MKLTLEFSGRNVRASDLVADIRDGEVRHGLSDGRWGLIDLLRQCAIRTGTSAEVALAVWTAADGQAGEFLSFCRGRRVARIRLCVDRSFVSRKPEACAKVVEMYGADAVRTWQCHAKFAVFTGGDVDLLVLTSANLNRNRRIENFSVHASAGLAAEYLAMVDDLWRGDGSRYATAAEILGKRGSAGG